MVFASFWWADPGEASPPKQILGLNYTFDGSDIPTILNRYDFLFCDPIENNNMGTIHASNPNIKGIYYDNALTHEPEQGDPDQTDYALRDYNTGYAIRQIAYDWRLHDISNPKYRTQLANKIASRFLSTHANFDGVFLDDVWASIDENDFYIDHEGYTKNNHPTFPPGFKTNFASNMILLLRAVKTAMGSKLLIPNMGDYTNHDPYNYLAEVDGQVDEGFAHATWQDANTFLSTDSWVRHINNMISAARAGKYYLTWSGVVKTATQDQINRLEKYCYASFLMGTDGGTRTKFTFSPDDRRHWYWYPDWNIDLGSPLGQYSRISGKNSFRRNFSNGIVLVNPTDRQEIIALEKNYKNQSGESVSSVTLSAREGAILLNPPSDAMPPAAPKGLKILTGP